MRCTGAQRAAKNSVEVSDAHSRGVSSANGQLSVPPMPRCLPFFWTRFVPLSTSSRGFRIEGSVQVKRMRRGQIGFLSLLERGHLGLAGEAEVSGM